MSLLSFPRAFKLLDKEQSLSNLYQMRSGEGAEFCSDKTSEESQGDMGTAWVCFREQTLGRISVCELKGSICTRTSGYEV